MKMSMRKNLAILLLSGTTALAGPAFAQQADPANPLLVPEGQGQGSTQTEGSTDTNAGSEQNYSVMSDRMDSTTLGGTGTLYDGFGDSPYPPDDDEHGDIIVLDESDEEQDGDTGGRGVLGIRVLR